MLISELVKKHGLNIWVKSSDSVFRPFPFKILTQEKGENGEEFKIEYQSGKQGRIIEKDWIRDYLFVSLAKQSIDILPNLKDRDSK